ncbi:acylphosphatase [Pleomorphomonas oryzae]|uniref:acylphosphatase n=1 Tax=Pleomorphomonas oryzae TaxID=261934 RepID=UPI0004107454|nr:acylphosphatase [Pleomorphomonas oryzae]
MPAAHERLTIRGNLGAGSFLPWVARHAARLGLDGEIHHADAGRVDIDLRGPTDLIDAMEMGCLLGPIDVWVETIDRTPNPSA